MEEDTRSHDKIMLHRIDAREVCVRLFDELTNHPNIKISQRDFIGLLNNCNIQVTERSFILWKNNFYSTGFVVAQHKENDEFETFSLDYRELRVMIGYIEEHVRIHNPRTLDQVQIFVFNLFRRSISKSTLENYCGRYGIRTKLVIHRGGDVLLSRDAAIDLCLKFLLELRERKIIPQHAQDLLCMDFTYTSHRSETRYALGGQGETLKGQIDVPKFTNCILCCNCASGESFPCIIFTANPDFKKFAGNYAFSNEDYDETKDATFQTYGIRNWRVVFLGAGNKQLVGADASKPFVHETQQICSFGLRRWNRYYKADLKKYICLTDAGGSFKGTFMDVHFKEKLTLTPEIHAYQSTCDHGLLSVAKA